MGLGADQMSAEVESVVDSGVSGQEALGGAGRSKALHPPLSSPGRKVGALRPVVLPLALDVLRRDSECAERGTVDRR